MRETGAAPVRFSRLSEPQDLREQMAVEVKLGLTAFHKHLPSKYFYDARGSELFEEITRLPEYYLTRAETTMLEQHAGEIMDTVAPHELVEFGSGSSKKTMLLIDAMHRAGGTRYVPIDISEDALRAAAKELCSTYSWLEIDALAGDYLSDFGRVRRRGRRLIVFLGSTIGNYTPTLRHSLLRTVAFSLEPGDRFLLGVDLIKDEETMVAAYDDSEGVSAEFNKNILNVVNRELDGDIPLDAFEHITRFEPEHSCMSQGLRAERRVVANIKAIDLAVTFEEGEEIHTEVSCKFNEEMVRHEFEAAGMSVQSWMTDPSDYCALALGAPKTD